MATAKELLLPRRDGGTYSIRSGLPPVLTENGPVKVHEIPTVPHVFTVDRFQLRTTGGELLVDAPGPVRVLSVHGVVRDGSWYTGVPELHDVPVGQIAADADCAGLGPVDVLFVCASQEESGVSRPTVIFRGGNRSTNGVHARVQMEVGHVATGFGVRTMQTPAGQQTSLDMMVSDPSHVLYRRWLRPIDMACVPVETPAMPSGMGPGGDGSTGSRVRVISTGPQLGL